MTLETALSVAAAGFFAMDTVLFPSTSRRTPGG
jgi:hypothetical protein